MDRQNDDSANADYCRRHDLYACPYAHDPRDYPGGAAGQGRDACHGSDHIRAAWDAVKLTAGGYIGRHRN